MVHIDKDLFVNSGRDGQLHHEDEVQCLHGLFDHLLDLLIQKVVDRQRVLSLHDHLEHLQTLVHTDHEPLVSVVGFHLVGVKYRGVVEQATCQVTPLDHLGQQQREEADLDEAF